MVDASVHHRAPYLQAVDLSAEQCHAGAGKRDVREQTGKQFSERDIIGQSKIYHKTIQ